jgi:1-phosphofructokinase family hexose kinase
LVPGNVHRAQKSTMVAGGKGLNVARSIRTLGGEMLCMGFAGGYMGHLLSELAQKEGLPAVWTRAEVETRICTILVPQDGDATVVNDPGMPVSKSNWKQLREDVRKQLPSASIVCISGSLPLNSAAEDWQELLSALTATGKQVWVDTSGSALRTALAHPGICIKVNGAEIGEALGFEVKDIASAQHALHILRERGLRAAAITLGSAGALLATQNGQWYARGSHVQVVSTVGSGDSFLGGLVYALEMDSNCPQALGDAVAAGTANTLSAGGGQFALQEFKSIREQMRVEDW